MLPPPETELLDPQTPEQQALSKLINPSNPDRNIGFHTMGFYKGFLDNERIVVGGLLNTEQALNQGLLSKQLGNRASVTRSNLGENKDNPFLNKEDHISLYQPNFWSGTRYIYRGWNLVCRIDPKRRNIDFDFTGSPETQVKGRVKPEDIIGIVAQRTLLDQDIQKYLDDLITKDHVRPSSYPSLYEHDKVRQTDFKLKLVQQLYKISQDLHVNLESENQEQIEQSLKSADDLQGKCLGKLRERWGREKGLGATIAPGETNTPEYKEGLQRIWNTPLENDEDLNRIQEEVLRVYHELAPLIYSHPDFANIRTFKDYLIKLGNKYKIPIYSEEESKSEANYELVWPPNADAFRAIS